MVFGRHHIVSRTSALEERLYSNTSIVFTPQDNRPARHILHLDFNQFRTIGMRRSVHEGVHSRFVTGERLELALKVRTCLIISKL
jgi:hypothetical protein